MWGGSRGTGCSSLRTTPKAPGLAWSPCRPRKISGPGPARRPGSAPRESERTSPETSSYQIPLFRPQSDWGGRSQTPAGCVRSIRNTDKKYLIKDQYYEETIHHPTSHIKVLSSYILISLVLTSFPWKGPKRAPLGILRLSAKTPQLEAFPQDAWRMVNPAAQSQSGLRFQHSIMQSRTHVKVIQINK